MAIKVKIREDLHKIIDQLEDERILEAIYVLLEHELRQRDEFMLSPENLIKLDNREERHKNGDSRSYSWEESLQKIRSGI